MIVPADPMVSVPTEGVVALGIVGREIVADPVAILMESANVQSAVHASVTLPVPSAL